MTLPVNRNFDPARLFNPESLSLSGAGTALMRAIIAWARSKGVETVQGQILSDNAPMLSFIRRLGFILTRTPGEPDIMEAELTL